MKINDINYIASVVVGLFVGSLILFISRLLGIPITGIIISIVLSAFITTFLYDPYSKKKVHHLTLRGTATSVIFSLIFGIMLTIYYVPRLGSLFGTADISISVSILIILLIRVLCGLILGSIGGSIGSTFRNLYTVFVLERKKH
jgi:hypothetical protein